MPGLEYYCQNADVFNPQVRKLYPESSLLRASLLVYLKESNNRVASNYRAVFKFKHGIYDVGLAST